MSAEAPPVSILLIEHDSAYADLLAARLRESLNIEYKLSSIPTLTAAFEHMDAQPCHLVIADLDLPESGGVLTFKALLEHSNNAIPIIALVANENDTVVSELFEKGAIDVREKRTTTGIGLARAIRSSLECSRQQKELDQAKRDLKNFAQAAARDMKAPLATILQFLDMLVADMGEDAFSPESAEYLDVIRDSSERSVRLIDDLLKFSQLGSDAMKARRADLTELAQRAVSDLESLLSATGAEVEIGELPEIEAEPDLIVQVLKNLIANSIEYRSERPPRIAVTADSSPTMVVVSVQDNGVGIDGKHFSRIFEPFRRVGAPAGSGGSGLGLSICKRIIEGHRGRIWLESKLGEGSTFHFSLPKAQRPTLPGAVTLETQSPAL